MLPLHTVGLQDGISHPGHSVTMMMMYDDDDEDDDDDDDYDQT